MDICMWSKSSNSITKKRMRAKANTDIPRSREEKKNVRSNRSEKWKKSCADISNLRQWPPHVRSESESIWFGEIELAQINEHEPARAVGTVRAGRTLAVCFWCIQWPCVDFATQLSFFTWHSCIAITRCSVEHCRPLLSQRIYLLSNCLFLLLLVNLRADCTAFVDVPTRLTVS